MIKTLIKALRTPIAKLVTRAVGYSLAFIYAKAGIDAGEISDDTAAVANAMVAIIIGGMTALADYLHHKADRNQMPGT
jgi:hypothetical protein